MKIEVLYPEICCLFGDKANMRYLELCLPEAEFVRTPLSKEPHFLSDKVDMVYFGSMSESSQSRVLSRLVGHEERINELISDGTVFLMTGNSFEIFGNHIETEQGERIETLGLFDFYAKRTIPKRFNSLFLGSFGEEKIVGYTSRFSHTYGANENEGLFQIEKGYGLNPEAAFEGVRRGNLFGTYLLGPLLIQNPDFTAYLQTLLGLTPHLAYEKAIREAYETRLAEFRRDIVFAE